MDNYPSDCIQQRKGDVLLVKYPPAKKHDPAYSTFRSKVFYKDELVAVSPVKSIPYDTFSTKYTIQECRVEEFVEGTMINVWYGNNKWNIATRSVIDAMCTFESDKTFSEMFYECMALNPIDFQSGYCYSLVMQHPDNNIVTPVDMKLYVVGRYKIVEGTAVECYEVCPHSPRTFSVSSYAEAEALAQNTLGKGLMLTCHGERAKIKRSTYYELETLKGNSTFQYRYLSIRNTPEMAHFLNAFPWYTSEAVLLENNLHKLSTAMYKDYVSYYIRKHPMPPGYPYKKIMYDIHGIYLSIRPTRVSFSHVSSLIQRLHPSQLTRLLREQKTPRTTPTPPGMIL